MHHQSARLLKWVSVRKTNLQEGELSFNSVSNMLIQCKIINHPIHLFLYVFIHIPATPFTQIINLRPDFQCSMTWKALFFQKIFPSSLPFFSLTCQSKMSLPSSELPSPLPPPPKNIPKQSGSPTPESHLPLSRMLAWVSWVTNLLHQYLPCPFDFHPKIPLLFA